MKCWPSLEPFGKNLPLSGGSLFYYDSKGDGNSKENNSNKQTVVLIHGLGDEADTWRYLFPALSDAGYRVIAPDLPGFGRSIWKGRISVSLHCRIVLRLLAMANVFAEKPAVLIGSSLGAGIAELVAAKRPDLVKDLILIGGCFPYKDKPGKSEKRLMMPFIGKNWYRAFRSNHETAWKSLYPYYGNLYTMSNTDKEFLRERVIARVESTNQEKGFFSTLRSMARLIVFKRNFLAKKIKNFHGKIFIVWGERDNIFPARRASFLRRLRPDAEFSVIAEAGHLPHQEKGDECAAEILRMINR